MRNQQELSYIGPRNVGSMIITQDQVESFCQVAIDELKSLGICFDESDLRKMQNFMQNGEIGMDADLTPPLTGGSITTPIQFLQHWLPGFVKIITAARRIDNLVGITTQGNFADEEIVQGVMEYTGNARPYGDYNNIPLSSWNVNYVRRSIVRFEEGITVGRLEEMRASAIRVNAAESKRGAAVEALEILRNNIGFNGYNGGINRTYGILNEVGLPAYVNVPNGGGGNPEWSTKTFLEIVADLLTALTDLRIQSRDVIDVKKTPITLAIATAAVDRLSTVSDFGISVQEWLNKNYPNVRIESAPEFDDANGGDNVFYLYAETVGESGSDDSRTFIQVVPNKFQSMGVDQRGKNYTESYANATSGIMLKRPYAVVRRSGI